MVLPESLGNGQGPSTPQTDALRATVRASTVPDSSSFEVWIQVHPQSPNGAPLPGNETVMFA
jgi:hypothetical protein